MKARELIRLFELETAAGEKGLDREIEAGYCGDLLSDVMANAPRGAVWLTVQSHQNIVAVAVLREMAAVILVNGRPPDEETKAKAEEEGIPIFVTSRGAYEMAGLLYKAGISGNIG
ncbi:MAG: serine kinase [Deltaproteobacteria bacterium]|nr:serine kinase [Deltaproteobacteria bacterium]MBW2015588.1 serine kinase [Deltaproteobacteria bacterium]MBW2128086.1 serine kinase [Deltaproteobacteria bacterium]MBW2302997.1 serine kinase [Deltaproteobacteria bacterium]